MGLMAAIRTFDLIDTGPYLTFVPQMGSGNPQMSLGQDVEANTSVEANTKLVLGHFADFVNNRDLGAIDRNLDSGFVDHDGPGGRMVDRAADRAMMAKMHQMFPDLLVVVKDAVAQGDKVVVRNLWTGTQVQTGRRIEFHGFVMWRIAAGKIVERWATVTPMHEITAEALEW
jgi:predicted ester cyclase